MANWKLALRAACARGQWQKASAIAVGANLDKAGWKRVVDYIEGEKAKVLAQLTAEWRTRRGR